MSDRHLDAYVGRYKHRQGSGLVLEFTIGERGLIVRATGHPDGYLEHAGGHTFAGIGFPLRFEFEAPDRVHPDSLLLVGPDRDRSSLAAYDRQEPFCRSDEPPSESIDLGRVSLCAFANPREATCEFYRRLGFQPDPEDARAEPNPQREAVLSNGQARVFFMDFVKKSPEHAITGAPINFRGANVREIATELSRRGFPLPGLAELPTTGSGAFLVMDPDDNGIFFNTHPPEVAEYARWTLNKPAVEPIEVELPLGTIMVCYDVTDLQKSTQFYKDLGLQLADTAHETAVFTAIPPHATPEQVPESFHLRLRQAKVASQDLAFLCQDPGAVAAEITKRGIEMVDAEEGPAFVDPQGRKVTLLQR